MLCLMCNGLEIIFSLNAYGYLFLVASECSTQMNACLERLICVAYDADDVVAYDVVFESSTDF